MIATLKSLTWGSWTGRRCRGCGRRDLPAKSYYCDDGCRDRAALEDEWNQAIR